MSRTTHPSADPMAEHRVVLVTGAASGLGWALAQAFHARGDAVLLVDRDAPLLATRVEGLGATRARGMVCDLTEATDRDALVEEVRVIGRLDVLVHNAGITHRSLATRTDPDVIRRVMEVNYHAPVALTHRLLPWLRASRGSLVAISSMAGWMPVPGRAGYGASKSALTQYFEVMRLELAADGVHVLLAHPSFLDTPIERNALGADGTPAGHPRSTVGRIRSPDWQAARILTALEARRPTTAMEWVPGFGALLWRVWPALYRRMIARRFVSDLG